MRQRFASFRAALRARSRAAGHQLFIVGGCVRDVVMGVGAHRRCRPGDRTRGTPDATIRDARRTTGFKAIPDRRALRDDHDAGRRRDTVEITTFRVGEIYERGSRHPNVEFGDRSRTPTSAAATCRSTRWRWTREWARSSTRSTASGAITAGAPRGAGRRVREHDLHPARRPAAPPAHRPLRRPLRLRAHRRDDPRRRGHGGPELDRTSPTSAGRWRWTSCVVGPQRRRSGWVGCTRVGALGGHPARAPPSSPTMSRRNGLVASCVHRRAARCPHTVGGSAAQQPRAGVVVCARLRSGRPDATSWLREVGRRFRFSNRERKSLVGAGGLARPAARSIWLGDVVRPRPAPPLRRRRRSTWPTRSSTCSRRHLADGDAEIVAACADGSADPGCVVMLGRRRPDARACPSGSEDDLLRQELRVGRARRSVEVINRLQGRGVGRRRYPTAPKPPTYLELVRRPRRTRDPIREGTSRVCPGARRRSSSAA